MPERGWQTSRAHCPLPIHSVLALPAVAMNEQCTSSVFVMIRSNLICRRERKEKSWCSAMLASHVQASPGHRRLSANQQQHWLPVSVWVTDTASWSVAEWLSRWWWRGRQLDATTSLSFEDVVVVSATAAALIFEANDRWEGRERELMTLKGTAH